MNKTIFITEPNHDYTTRYISTWAECVVAFAESKNDYVVSLKNTRANKKTFVSVLNKINPSFIFLNGHGNDRLISGHNNEPIVELSDKSNILEDKIVYALSCQSAKKLGPHCVKNGTKTYLGYTEDFIFTYDKTKRTRPSGDKIAALFLDSSNKIPLSLLKNKTTGEAYDSSQRAFRKTVRSLLTSESALEQSATLRYLVWDMNHQVCLGDTNVKI